MTNPTHIQEFKYVTVPYVLRSRVTVAEDNKFTSWNPNIDQVHMPYDNGFDGVSQKNTANTRPFQYIWVDPDYTIVRRPEVLMDSASWANLFYHTDTSYATRLEILQRIGDAPESAGSPVQTMSSHQFLKELLELLGEASDFDHSSTLRSKAQDTHESRKSVHNSKKQKQQHRRSLRQSMIHKLKRSAILLLRGACVWALVRIGNISQSASSVTLSAETTLNVLIMHFKKYFFLRKRSSSRTKSLQYWDHVDASRCFDNDMFKFKSELVSAIAAVRDSEGRSPIDACLFLRKVLNDDIEWLKPTCKEGRINGMYMVEHTGYTASLIQALANTFIYSKLIFILLRNRPVHFDDLPRPIQKSTDHRLKLSIKDIEHTCKRILGSVDDIFTTYNFFTTRRSFVSKTTLQCLEDYRVQVSLSS